METKDFNTKIELINDGRLSLFFIGTGNAFTNSFFQTNLLVVKGNDHILIDCGTLCPFVFKAKYRTNISEINNLLLTHPHADHIGGVEELAFISRYTKKQKINLIITDEFKKKLWNESLKGGLHFSDTGVLSFDDYFNQVKPKVYIKKPFKIYNCQCGSINIKLFRTIHVSANPDSFKNAQISYGMIFDDKVLFTADTQFRKAQLEWLTKNFNLEAIFHDCDIRGFSMKVHAGYSQLKGLDPEMKKKMYLCHYDAAKKTVNPVADGFAGFTEPGKYYIF